MREYYILLPQTLYISYEYENLKKRVDKFNKKRFSGGVFTYWSMHGWGPGECLRQIFIYKENGAFYEFFSGYKIGNETSTDHGTYILGETFEPIILSPISSDTSQKVHPLTPSQFASDIEYHMKEKKQIAKIMKEYFELHHQIWLTREQERLSSEALKLARDNHKADWLEKYLDKR